MSVLDFDIFLERDCNVLKFLLKWCKIGKSFLEFDRDYFWLFLYVEFEGSFFYIVYFYKKERFIGFRCFVFLGGW